MDTVDGRNPAPVDMVNIIKYPITYSVSYMLGGAGFLPSTKLVCFCSPPVLGTS